MLLDLEARFEPEAASEHGVEGHDEQVMDLNPGLAERRISSYREAERILRARLVSEKDPAVRADIELLIEAASLEIDGTALRARMALPFFDPAAIVFRGLTVLLDDQVPEQRRSAALARLQRYTGLADGSRPLTELAAERTRERLGANVVFPPRARVEKLLTTSPMMLDGLGKLLSRYAVVGHEKPLAKLREQMVAYTEFVRTEVAPRARVEFRQPPELYQLALRESGIDAPPLELAVKAREAFVQAQKEMQRLAPEVARAKGINASDYRDVIRELKKNQLEGDALLAVYRKRIEEIDAILRRERLVPVPTRAMRVRLATDAESARMPAPFFNTPRLLGNTGETGEFVLPTRLSADPGKRLDDFSYEAASWWLTAHEGRPGHELQFSTMIEKKVSIARALFAFNSVNAEGWGLYAEDLLRPYMPPEGQLICLQARLMRAAHAFLDIELNLGKITTEEARRVLLQDGVFSEAWANQAIERYTFTWPAQAPSYFYGYMRLVELRTDVAQALGPRFDAGAFHDFILTQGLVSPAVMRRATFAQFVKKTGAAAGG